jgi:hypothetical protein
MSEREALKKAVVKVGKSVAELTKVFERFGSKISEDDFKKAYLVLNRALAASQSKAAIDRQISQVADDAFDLDSVNIDCSPVAPPAPVINNVVQFVQPSEVIGDDDPRLADPAFRRRVERHKRAKALGGRLSKFAKDEPIVITELPPDDDEESFLTPHEPDDGADFIDD